MKPLWLILTIDNRCGPPAGDLVTSQFPHAAATHALTLMPLIVAPSRYAPIAAA
jgi:hypothetical protein